MEDKKQSKGVFTGVVVSESGAKTRIVEVRTRKRHPKYKKIYMVRRRFAAHDPEESYHIGDVVNFIPSRPYSRTKKFLIIGKAQKRA